MANQKKNQKPKLQSKILILNFGTEKKEKNITPEKIRMKKQKRTENKSGWSTFKG